MTEICFVGIHHKPGKPALCSSTKTGEIIDRIIEELGTDYSFTKKNLFPTEYYPKPKKIRNELVEQFDKIPGTLYILLGKKVHEYRHLFEPYMLRLEFHHPGAIRFLKGVKNTDDYVQKSSESICERIDLIEYIRLKYPSKYAARMVE